MPLSSWAARSTRGSIALTCPTVTTQTRLTTAPSSTCVCPTLSSTRLLRATSPSSAGKVPSSTRSG
ncbi:hypothetical protein E2C01_101773 [Portunus trituberculatus]|uniref:Uncharacterized protein n=1 Tax=Portunus trituberculatus TaxID=210409 RepID=A0A5B7KGK2_PORTR|nr:hypothetical protein [Portunus trituberculatus]